MKLLAEISEGSLGISEQFEQLGSNYKLRKSARAILLNEKGEVATQYLNVYNYHKLPGGGIEQGESIEEALKREVLEEVGCQCEIIKPIGMTIEYRNEINLLHISYAFVAKVIGEVGKITLDADEIKEGQETQWLAPEEILKKMEAESPVIFPSGFVLEREKTFLREFIKSNN